MIPPYRRTITSRTWGGSWGGSCHWRRGPWWDPLGSHECLNQSSFPVRGKTFKSKTISKNNSTKKLGIMPSLAGMRWRKWSVLFLYLSFNHYIYIHNIETSKWFSTYVKFKFQPWTWVTPTYTHTPKRVDDNSRCNTWLGEFSWMFHSQNTRSWA